MGLWERRGRLVQAHDFSRAWRAPTRRCAQGIGSGRAFTQAAGYQASLGWVCGNGREAWSIPMIFARMARSHTKMCTGHRIGEHLHPSCGLSGKSGMGLWGRAGGLVHARDFRAHGALPHEDVHRATDRGAPSPKLRAIRPVWDGFVGTGGRPGPCPGFFARMARSHTKMCAGHRIGERLQLSSGLSGRSGMGLWDGREGWSRPGIFRAHGALPRRCAQDIRSGSTFTQAPGYLARLK
ncbi:hypothetical protein M2262_000513 [Pseudomonas sp. BIGb0408]|uniref:Uncharacterized protein n=1 Tax=Phytopseudomonas flavescens TaxID=29435 RepID=A0A7Y9XRQ4_9GAMM|nr:hypothetical protein [Pseudomonas sp. BIGb0408]NYH74964.1 hypothetical protein [Pseudomonas flavescens]